MKETRVDPASFRDGANRVMVGNGEVWRCLSEEGLRNWRCLASKDFYRRFLSLGNLVETREIDAAPGVCRLPPGHWPGLLRHRPVRFLSYPYEWTFGMLKDAALLHLELLQAALAEGMILKDASAFNIQWEGSRPVFIDIGSFRPYADGEPWTGYRQFCRLFLYPLMLQAYKNIAFQTLLKGSPEGIKPRDCRNMMSLRDTLRPGVLTHVRLHAAMEDRYESQDSDVKDELRSSGFNKSLILKNIDGLRAIIGAMKWTPEHSSWSGYYQHNSYVEQDERMKKAFVAEAVDSRSCKLVWDLGCNRGVFSRLAAVKADYVVAMDGDAAVIEHCYGELKNNGDRSIVPLVMDFANVSSGGGWRGLEFKALEARGRPDLVLCLALIHHLAISANIPLAQIVDWLADVSGALIIEFIDEADPMARRLLRNKDGGLADYSRGYFEKLLNEAFDVQKRQELTCRTRVLYFAQAKS
ncbi:MAG: class I SAM-dependent methyltransferase [Elusimicrobia bacterium]|nr:class I SAM-dependent methyltransferase [Elusimicrobiota bacterium]